MHPAARHRSRLHPRGPAHSDAIRQAPHRAEDRRHLGVGPLFRILDDRIKTPGDGLIIFVGMQDHTAESIKCLEGFRDRLDRGSADALAIAASRCCGPPFASKARRSGPPGTRAASPTPSTSSCAREKPEGAIVVQSNWRDNPWFTEVLEAERQLDLRRYPERYEHVWEGGYARAFEGAYFASVLNAAKAEGRIGRVAADPLLPLRAFCDLGGSGATADAMAIWIVQWVGQEIRVLDYIEGIGQVLAYYVDELGAAQVRQGHLLPSARRSER